MNDWRENWQDFLGQMFLLGFDGCEYSSSFEKFLKKYRPGGIIFFKRNIPASRTKLKTFISRIYEAAEELNMSKPMVVIDHEGGRVHRLNQLATHFPAPGRCSQLSLEYISKIHTQQAQELSYFGFNTVCAPVLDLCPVDAEGGIGDRSFGTSPELSAKKTLTAFNAFCNNGIVPVPKHFPGHGHTKIDPHFALPQIDKTLLDFEEEDLLPFIEIINAKPGFLMSAHVLVPSVDKKWPVTLSETWIKYLKNKLQYSSVVLSDDITMHALWKEYSIETIIKQGVRAGIDIFTICLNSDELAGAYENSYNEMKRLVNKDESYKSKIFTSIQKVIAAKNSFLSQPRSVNEDIFKQGELLLKEIQDKC